MRANYADMPRSPHTILVPSRGCISVCMSCICVFLSWHSIRFVHLTHAGRVRKWILRDSNAAGSLYGGCAEAVVRIVVV